MLDVEYFPRLLDLPLSNADEHKWAWRWLGFWFRDTEGRHIGHEFEELDQGTVDFLLETPPLETIIKCTAI